MPFQGHREERHHILASEREYKLAAQSLLRKPDADAYARRRLDGGGGHG